ncbi:hypothetical protein [Nitratifractor sp.]
MIEDPQFVAVHIQPMDHSAIQIGDIELIVNRIEDNIAQTGSTVVYTVVA